MSNRILETVKGRDAAEREIQTNAMMFNDCNGKGRMVPEKNAIRVEDSEGSGEFYEAVCLNANEAESGADEIWQIETAW